jgi:hypothetical protein
VPALVLLALAGCAEDRAPSTGELVAAAARQVAPEVAWQPQSVLAGDFTCRARPEHAILGTTADDVVVVVVVASGRFEPAGVVRVPAAGMDVKAVGLARDDLDFRVEDYERDVGPLPEGLHPSKTCMGLRIGDGRSAPVQVYWNRRAKRFDVRPR